MRYKPDIFAVAGGKKIMGLNPFGVLGVVLAVHEATKNKKEEKPPRNNINWAIVIGMISVLVVVLLLHYFFPFKG